MRVNSAARGLYQLPTAKASVVWRLFGVKRMVPRWMAFSSVMHSSGYFALTIAFALIVMGAITLRFAGGPHTLKVAVAQTDGADAKLITAMARRLEREGSDLRFAIVSVEDPAASAQALENGRADLAVIRTDLAIPSNGATVAILHRDLAALLAPTNAAIKKVTDLFKKRVGVFPPIHTNIVLLDAILAERKIAAEAVQHVMLTQDELSKAVQQKRVDAILAVGSLKGRSIEDAAGALAFADRAPVLIPIDVAGIAARGPAYQKAEIPAGFLRGSPPTPKEDLATVAIAIRLEARQNLSDEIVTRLTKRLFIMRRSLQSEAPLAAAMEKPDTDKSSADFVHPGAAAYYDNTEKSFIDLYGDWLYIGAMVFSGAVSAIAAMFGVLRTQARNAALGLISQLIDVQREAHAAIDLPRLAELELLIEDISTKGLHFARDHNFDEAGIAALRLAIDEARQAIADQRAVLEARTGLAPHAATARSPDPSRDVDHSRSAS